MIIYNYIKIQTVANHSTDQIEVCHSYFFFFFFFLGVGVGVGCLIFVSIKLLHSPLHIISLTVMSALMKVTKNCSWNIK
jgi:hypothetical protein